MSKVCIRFEEAKVYVPKDYETLAKIVEANCPDFTWEEFALYNWGTKRHEEVNRALIELYGCSEVDEANCTKSKLHAKYGPKGETREMRIPEIWKKEGLDLEKTHTVKLKTRKPFPAVAITSLDKWFIPETESCDFGYRLEGLKERADKLDFEVYGSKYSEATAAPDGDFLKYTFKDADVPLLQQKGKLKADERATDTVDTWRGESEATKGVLQPRGKKKRYVTVANSPYTIHLRYYKDAGDEKAQIHLKPFWVQWAYAEPKKIPPPQSLKDRFPLPGSSPAAAVPPATVSAVPLAPPKPVKTSLKIEWEVKKTSRLSHGHLTIFDKDFNVVSRQALASGDLSQGDHSWTWDDPAQVLVFGKMPYRVQIQAHSKADEENGLAIAAMHSEVRLYVHPDIGKELFDPLSENPKDPQCMKFSMAPFWHKEEPPAIGGEEWYKLRLAECGFYPGPVDTTARDEYTNAIKEFQRSIPKRTTPPPTSAEGEADTARTKEAESLKKKAEANLKKKKAEAKVVDKEKAVELLKKEKDKAETEKVKTDEALAKDASNAPLQAQQQSATDALQKAVSDVTAAEEEVKTAHEELKTAEAELKAATDDAKQATTDREQKEGSSHSAVAGLPGKKWERLTANGSKTPDTQSLLADLQADYHAMLAHEDRSDITGVQPVGARLNDPAQKAIVWVNDRHANTECDVAPPDVKMTMENYRGDMQIADGRVDKDKDSVLRPWIPLQAELTLLSKNDGLDRVTMPDPTEHMRQAIGPLRLDWTFTELGEDLDTLDVSGTNPQRIRTKSWVAHHIEDLKTSHKDVYFYNCPETLGGIRPSSNDSYYKAPFGLGAASLQPCKASEDSTNQSVYVLCHDDLGQEVEKVYDDHIGKPGIYLHPSNIAGDSYRFRAQVSFEKADGAWLFPNHEFLKKRYDRLPSAYTCGLRVWRKTSMRAYGLWSPSGTGNLGTSDSGSRKHYRNAFVHVVDEQGTLEQPVLNTLISSSDLTAFKNIVKNNSQNTRSRDKFKDENKITLNNDNLWPWLGEPHWNILASDSNVDFGEYENKFLDNVWTDTWRKFREPLLHLLLQRMEVNTGKLRGHFVVEFQSTPKYWKQMYQCDSCGEQMVMVESSSSGGSAGKCGEACGGTLEELWIHEYACDVCGYMFRIAETHDSSSHDYDGDSCDQAPCAGHFRFDSTTTVDKYIFEGGDSLPLPAVGVGLGATWIFSDGGDAATWAHEIAHHRHFSHAANVDGTGTKSNEHDRTPNTLYPDPDATGDDGLWDRDCVMSYSRDPQFFCGKCILKNRGWKVDTLANP